MPSMVSSDTAQNANYICVSLTALILTCRLYASRFQPQPYDASFFVVVFSVAILICRIVTTHFTLRLNTAADALYFAAHGEPWAEDRLSSVTAGTIFSLFGRLLETTFWWCQSIVLLLLYRRLASHVEWTRKVIWATWGLITITYGVVVMSTFLECTPFHHYYQISPDPGHCVRGYKQTLIQCLSSIAIDISLMVIAIPILQGMRGRQLSEQFRIGSLIALGCSCTVITCVRLWSIFAEEGLQPTRSFWAAIQILVSGFVANVPIFYGSLELRRRQSIRSKSHGDIRFLPPTRTGPLGGETGLDLKIASTCKHTIVNTFVVVSELQQEEDGDVQEGDGPEHKAV